MEFQNGFRRAPITYGDVYDGPDVYPVHALESLAGQLEHDRHPGAGRVRDAAKWLVDNEWEPRATADEVVRPLVCFLRRLLAASAVGPPPDEVAQSVAPSRRARTVKVPTWILSRRRSGALELRPGADEPLKLPRFVERGLEVMAAAQKELVTYRTVALELNPKAKPEDFKRIAESWRRKIGEALVAKEYDTASLVETVRRQGFQLAAAVVLHGWGEAGLVFGRDKQESDKD